MRKICLLFSLFILFLPTTSIGAGEEKERIIITFHAAIDESIVTDPRLELHHVFEKYLAISATVPRAMQKDITKNNRVKEMELDPLVTMEEQYVSWGTEAVLATEAHGNGLTGKGVKTGVIDTGIYSRHPDLVVSGGVSFIESEKTYHDEDGHGTHVAGIIAAQNNELGIVGVAPGVELFAIKAIGANGTGHQSDIVKGIEWSVAQGLDIVNLSITTPQKSSIMEKSFQDAYEKGLLIIAAAGNTDARIERDSDVLYPARFPSVIAVGSIGKAYDKSLFSYFGSSLEFVAPGEDIYSTYISGEENNLYAVGSGTSMAAPYVTGVAALYKEAYPNATNKEIRRLMHEAAVDLGEVGLDPFFGYGLIQAPVIVNKTTFSDVKKDAWYIDEVDYLYKRNIITGYTDGKFYPNEFVTRAEAVTMIGRTFGWNEDKQVTNYSDVGANHYASGLIMQATAANVVIGYPDNTFKPSESIIRGDTALLLQNIFRFEEKTPNRYWDVDEKTYYNEAIHYLKAANITIGYPDGTYRPQEKVTRAQFSVLLARSLEEKFRQ